MCPARRRSAVNRGRRARPRRSFVARLGRHLVLWATLAGIVWLVHLDRMVVRRFDQVRWDSPATIRFAPLTVRRGMRLDQTFLVEHLTGLGYRATRGASRPATFRSVPGRVEVHTRRGQRITLAFGKDRVVELADPAKGPRDAVAFEPAAIGSIYPTHSEIRYPVHAEAIPPALVKALLVTEDRRFFRHFGIDPAGVARAVLANLQAGKAVSGGSTLTQQLAKSMYLTPDRTLARKLRELVIALLLEAHYSKRDILEAYVNLVYLGQSGRFAIHGFGSAARHYFGRPLAELQVPEMALLVGLLKGASFYNPWRHPERARERRNIVLSAMGRAGLVTANELKRYLDSPLGIRATPATPEHADLKRLVAAGLRREGVNGGNLRRAGLVIETSIDPWIQHTAEAALSRVVARLDADNGGGTVQGAVVSVDYHTGAVVALVAGRGDGIHAFNRSTMAYRNIGSLIKPLLYLAWFENFPSRHPLTRVSDTAVAIDMGAGAQPWTPENYDRREHGQVTAAAALANSYNLAAVRVGLELAKRRPSRDCREVRTCELRRFLERAGVQRELQSLPPAALLGAVSLSPIEVAAIYQTLANEGAAQPLHVVQRLLTPDGRVARPKVTAPRRRMSPDAAVKTRYLMMRVTLDGTAARLVREAVPWPVAGKTGTSDEVRDSWFAGFDGRLLTVVWVGRDDNRPMAGRAGSAALEVWRALMRTVGVSPLLDTDEASLSWFGEADATDAAGRCPFRSAFPAYGGRPPPGFVTCTAVIPPR